MNIIEEQPLRGSVRMKIYRGGKLVEETHEKNLILNGGRSLLAQLLTGDDTPALSHVTHIAYGEGTTAAVLGNVHLEGPNVITKAVDGAGVVGTDAVFEWSIGVGEGNGLAISEMALIFHNGFENQAFSRYLRPGGAVNKAADMAIVGTWTISF